MFTGLIQETGRVARVKRVGGGVHISVKGPAVAPELHVDDSVTVNGACQTVISKSGDTFTVEAVEETLSKTTLGQLKSGDSVNLELAMRLGDRMGGHIVQGHVDCVGTVRQVEKKASSWLLSIGFPAGYSRYVVPVGSIAVDGISLTVASTKGDEFTVSIIPHTLAKTTLAGVRKGGKVNLEFDILGKYIEKLLEGRKQDGEGVTREKLKEWGWG